MHALATFLLLSGVSGLAVPWSGRSSQSLRVAPRRVTNILLGWGPDPIWTAVAIDSITEPAQGHKAVTVAPPKETVAAYTIPGQYVQMREIGAEKAITLAIASAPGVSPFEFLIKEHGPSDWSPGTGWLTDASPGLDVEMSQVMGGGFKSVGDSPSVVLFAVGSGISPIRSVIESGTLKGKKATLYYGARTPAMMAYTDKFEAWEALGVECVPVLSQPDESWDGATGYVQDVARAKGVPPDCAMLICGMKGMAEGVKALAADSGVSEDKVIANF